MLRPDVNLETSPKIFVKNNLSYVYFSQRGEAMVNTTGNVLKEQDMISNIDISHWGQLPLQTFPLLRPATAYEKCACYFFWGGIFNHRIYVKSGIIGY